MAFYGQNSFVYGNQNGRRKFKPKISTNLKEKKVHKSTDFVFQGISILNN